MKIDWPKELVKDIASRKCVIFMGSGISMNSVNSSGQRPPSWSEFIEEGISRIPLVKRNYKDVASGYRDRKDLLMACEVIKEGLGRDQFIDLLKEKFQKPKYEPANIHKIIFDLDSRIVITPNFDKIYDTYATATTNGFIVITSYYGEELLDCIRRDEPVIVKLHGTIDTPNKLIFSKRDYSKAWYEHQKFYRIIESLMLTHTFLYLGAGLNDPDVRLLMESIAISYYPSRTHYFVIPEEDLDIISERIYSNLLNIKFLKYSKNNSHIELLDSLKDLYSKVDNMR